MVKCSAPLCRNATYRKTPEITFHRFPIDEKMKVAWLSNMNRQNWQPTNSASVLCSKHFEAHLIDSSGFRTVLAPGAIPTILDWLQENIAPAASDNNLAEIYAQPSTSGSTLSQQDVIPASSLKGPIKRSACGHHIFPAMQNVQLSTSTAPCQYNIPTVPLKCVLKESTEQDSVLPDVPNIQPISKVPLNLLYLLQLLQVKDKFYKKFKMFSLEIKKMSLV